MHNINRIVLQGSGKIVEVSLTLLRIKWGLLGDCLTLLRIKWGLLTGDDGFGFSSTESLNLIGTQFQE